MNGIVVDASVTLSWCFSDEQTPLSRNVLDQLLAGDQFVVPAFWSLEVLNTLLVGERKGRIRPEQTKAFVDTLRALNPTVDFASLEQVTGPIQVICRDHRLTPYDALYVELALRSVGAPCRPWINHKEKQQQPSEFIVCDADQTRPSRHLQTGISVHDTAVKRNNAYTTGIANKVESIRSSHPP